MEKLTVSDDLGNIAIKNLPWSKIINSNLDMDDKDVLWKCIEKLNEYEEIGLSPEDVERTNTFVGSEIERLLVELQKYKDQENNKEQS